MDCTPPVSPPRDIRPAGGARYHDLLPLVGTAGIGLTLRGAGGRDRAFVAVDVARKGFVAYGDDMDGGCTRDEAVAALVERGPGNALPAREYIAFRQLLPPDGLPWRRLARAAVSAVRVPEEMRAALNALLDVGPPSWLHELQSLRAEAGDPMWETLTLACTRQGTRALIARPEVRTFLVERAHARRLPRLASSEAPSP